MKALLLTLLHWAVMTATLCGPGGVRAVIAENLLLKQQLIVVRRPRQRAPRLTASDRLLFGFGSLFLSPGRIRKVAIGVRLSVSNSLSGRHWELDQGPAVGNRTDIVQLGTGHHVSAGEGQRRVALQRRVAAYLVGGGQTPGATQRGLNPGFSERIGNSRRTSAHRWRRRATARPWRLRGVPTPNSARISKPRLKVACSTTIAERRDGLA